MARLTHYLSRTPTHRAWESMKQRCYNPNNPSYSNYGGRGISVCDEWRNNFMQFFEDMGECPKGYSLDRIDVNGNYEPSNCRWADWQTQHRNRTNNHCLTYDGVTKTMAEWSTETGIPQDTMLCRLKAKWSLHDVLYKPLRKYTRKE